MMYVCVWTLDSVTRILCRLFVTNSWCVLGNPGASFSRFNQSRLSSICCFSYSHLKGCVVYCSGDVASWVIVLCILTSLTRT
ncbi:hypothetical protein M758_4G270200 [Ceratodon purpureus]|nr:hypothetical protein M758_4G270200 [Ceratodon purpureus]